MKTAFSSVLSCLAALAVMGPAAVQAQGVQINLAASQVGVVDGQNLRISNVEYAGRRYILEVQWNPLAATFVPTRVSEQAASGLLCNAPVFASNARAGTLMLQVDPANRAVQVSAVNDGPQDPWSFSLYGWRFVHNQTAYALTLKPSDVDPNTALMNLASSSLYSVRPLARGERLVVGTINNLPAGFNFNMPITSVVYGNQTTACQ